MTPELLDILRCPVCVATQPAHHLNVLSAEYQGHRIWQGQLQCPLCQASYPIKTGVPRFFENQQQSVQEAIATNFGDAWQLYADANQANQKEDSHPQVHPYKIEQFIDWIYPLTLADFKDQRVLDLGSGLGGFTEFCAGSGARHVVGLEISHAVDSAVGLLAAHPNLDFVQANILQPPFVPETFDCVYSIGVLHHLETPKQGFLQAAKLTAAKLFIWVYGRENNGFVVHLVDPLRKLLSKLPVSVVRLLIALPMALILYPLLKTLYHPSLGAALKGLPYWDYFQWLRQYGFGYTRGMITDQLIPPRTHYHSEPELRGWFNEAGFVIQSMTHRNAISWRVLGQKI